MTHVVKKYAPEDMHESLKNCANKFKLCISHLVHVHNQLQRIKETHYGLEPGV